MKNFKFLLISAICVVFHLQLTHEYEQRSYEDLHERFNITIEDYEKCYNRTLLPCEQSKNHQIGSDFDDIRRMNCSEKYLTWTRLIIYKDVLQTAYYATEIDLSLNKFYYESNVIKNYSFHQFQYLKFKLDLSSNMFEDIEVDAFKYANQSGYLNIATLNLSNNNFKSFPYKAVGRLENLKNLYLSYNHIERFDFDENENEIIEDDETDTQIMRRKPQVENLFKKLKYLHLNNCKLKYLNYEFIKYLNLGKLTYLNLNNNDLMTLDLNFQNIFKNSIYLNIQQNPLSCDCNLLWLKNYLKKQHENPFRLNYDNHDDLSIKKEFESIKSDKDILINKFICQFDYNKYITKLNKTMNETADDFIETIIPINEQSVRVPISVNVSIVGLDDKQFMCPITIINDTITIYKLNKQHISLVCEVYASPFPHIWWLFDEKRITRDTTDPKKYEVKEETIIDKRNTSIFHVKSTLTVSQPIGTDVGTYTCCVSYRDAQAENKNNQEILLLTSTTLPPTLFDKLPENYVISIDRIYAQRLNQTIFKEIRVGYENNANLFIATKASKKSTNTSQTEHDIEHDSLSGFFKKNKNIIFIILLFVSIIIVFALSGLFIVILIRHCTKETQIDYEHDYKDYDEIQKFKLRQHDGYDDYDDIRYNNYRPSKIKYENENVEYDEVSKDDDALSTITSKSSKKSDNINDEESSVSVSSSNTSNNSAASNNEIDEDLNEYQDPAMMIDLRKPGQIV